jgi:hypothetical protein
MRTFDRLALMTLRACVVVAGFTFLAAMLTGCGHNQWDAYTATLKPILKPEQQK